MTSAKNRLVVISAVLIVLGIVAMVLQPGPPDGECVPPGAPSSGFVDSESGCGISDESYEKIADYNSSPKPFRIVGLLLIVSGIGVGGVALVKRTRSSSADE